MTPPIARNAENAQPRQWAFWLMVVLIFIGALALRVQSFALPWSWGHMAWGGAFYGNVARNFLRYGFLGTEFAPVVSTGLVDPGQFEIYFHHPLGVMWVTAGSFHIFGVHEWSARLAPLIFSLLTIGVVLEFARAVYGKGIALCAMLFMAVLPIDAFYATHLDPNGSMSLFFTALAVEGYRRWHDSGRDRDYALCAISIVLGCVTAWFTYLVIPGIVAHGWFFHRGDRTRGLRVRLCLLPIFALVVFGLFFVHRAIALSGRPPEVFDSLGDRFVKRTVGFGMGRGRVALIYLRQIWALYTFPIVVLTATWVVFFVKDLWNKRLQLGDYCIAIMLSYGFIYALIFPGHLPGHDFFARTYAPGVSLACAVALFRVAGNMSRPAAQLAVIGVMTACVCVVATLRVRFLYHVDDGSNGRVLRGFGEAVAAHTTLRDPVFTPFPGDKVMEYYVDRPMTFNLNTPEKLEAAVTMARGQYLIVMPERDAGAVPELHAYLRDRYPERLEKGLFMFQGTERNRLR